VLTPRPYQLVGRDFLAARSRALLADQMRVGKTPQAILALDKLALDKVLVVCPAVACEHWRREFAKWGTQPRAVAVLGPDYPPASVGVTIASYDRARLARDALCAARWDALILDECHYAKNPSSQRTRLVYGPQGLGWHADRIWSLSGTPATKHAGELWPMLRAFGIVGMTYDEFTSRYCWFKNVGKIGGTKESMIPELRALLARCMLRRTRKDVAPDLPPIGFDYLEVVPTGVQLPTAGIPADASPEDLLEYLEERSATMAEFRSACASAKAPPLAAAVHDDLEAGLITQTVIFGHHVDPLEWIAASLRRRGWRAEVVNGSTSNRDRVRIQDAFRAGTVDVICGNIQAAGTAIDLSSARHGYFLELDWLPANNAQAASRLVSLDKTDPVTFDVATWMGSADEAVQSVLMRRSRELARLI
jgi:SNF2 family DNA or RNA helicase